ncbi:hypothetical protein FD723_37260 (plasmid) [Nostoc sp. C052]|uniref:hypothetical protein n=1 Tax=Nostoc sp. C052 TaxID=2576902 RepID=UPI0015C4048D|nr:hypothetical protein [Nostoc sp. C052]QLE45877.1 hypothetical protein FD723_37260 [Nostoc sp. C052]
MYFKWASASCQANGGGSPPRMGSQLRGLFQSEKGLYFFLVPFHSELKFLDNRVMDEPVHLAVEGCLQLELESKANLSASVLLVKPL